MTAASPYCLYADAFIRIFSASARPTASIALASAAPVSLTRSASARAASTVCVLVGIGGKCIRKRTSQKFGIWPHAYGIKSQFQSALLPLSLGDGLNLVSLSLGRQLDSRHQLLLLAPDLLLLNLDLLPALDHLKSDNGERSVDSL